MKNCFSFTLFLLSISFYAQVGINTTNPNAQLEVKSSNQATPANIDGIIIPKIDAFPVTNPTVAQNSMMVYLTIPASGKQPGFYYWDNATTSWIAISSSLNSTDTDWLKSPSGGAPNNTDDMYHMGRVRIGTNINNGYTLSLSGTGIDNNAGINSMGEVRAINNTANGSGTAWTFGEYTTVSGTNSGPSIGNYIKINNTNNSSEHDGLWIDMQNGNTTNNNRNGIRIDMSGTTTAYNWRVGLSNSISSDTSGSKAGVINGMSGIGSNYGVLNTFQNGSSAIGTYNNFISSPGGIGMYN